MPDGPPHSPRREPGVQGLRMRPDLVAVCDADARRHWTVKDPVACTYFRMTPEQWFLLQCFGEASSLKEVQRRYQDRFLPRKIDLPSLSAYASRLYEQGLLTGQRIGQGDALWERSRKRRGNRRLAALLSVLAIRLGGVDAQPLLDRFSFVGAVMFRRTTALLLALLTATAAVLLLGRWDQAMARLPGLQQFLSGGNLAMLVALFLVIKVLHELGHGLACRRFGAECRDIGVLLLAFFPCFYCDVSDTWMLRSRTRRAVVAAAGIYFELWIAAVCALLWYFSEPGWVNTLLLNIVVTCSVSTVLFNGNPLMRYDGYFILSDLLDVPNLKAKSHEAFMAVLAPLFTRRRRNRSTGPIGKRAFLIAYALAAGVYKVVVLTLILWAVYGALRVNGFEPLGQALVALTLAGLVVPGVWRLWGLVSNPITVRNTRWRRVAAAVALGVGLGYFLLSYPVPRTVTCSAVLQCRDSEHVFAPVAGSIRPIAEYGQTVSQGEPIAVLSSPEILLEQARREGELDELREALRGLQLRSELQPELLSHVPTAQEAVLRAEEQVETGREQIESLEILAPCDGVALAPPWADSGPDQSSRLSGWSGLPLAEANTRCSVEAGQLLCIVSKNADLDALLLIEQGDEIHLEAGQEVRLRLDQFAGGTVLGEIRLISSAEAQQGPWALEANRLRAQSRKVSAGLGDSEPAYLALVRLEETPAGVRLGSGAVAKVAIGEETVWDLLSRKLQQTFHFKL